MKIDTQRECAVSSQPPMHTARSWHAAVYNSPYLYILGGYGDHYLSECERLLCAESRWERLPALPVASSDMSAVELDNSLLAFGGSADGGVIDTVQKLSVDSLTWELMHIKLPQASNFFTCFKTESQVCLAINKTLYSFTALQVKSLKTLATAMVCDTSYYLGMWRVSYYRGGTLYYSIAWDTIESRVLGELA
jgi:hypothetical protein